jgi:hypothetical protein
MDGRKACRDGGRKHWVVRKGAVWQCCGQLLMKKGKLLLLLLLLFCFGML